VKRQLGTPLSLACGFVIGLCGMVAFVNMTRVDESSGVVSTKIINEQLPGTSTTEPSGASTSVSGSSTTRGSESSTTSVVDGSTTTTLAANGGTSTSTTIASGSSSSTSSTTVASSSTSTGQLPNSSSSTTLAGGATSTTPTTTTATTAAPVTTTTVSPAVVKLDDPVVAAVPTPKEGWPVRDIVFPVVGPASFGDEWGAYRGSIATHFHIGVDIIGVRLQPLVAVADGVIKRFVINHPTAGWGIVLTGSDGWEYRYYHVNNDTPGTDDGTNPEQFRFAPGLVPGDRVRAGQLIGYMGDSGDSETSVPHLHFEIHRPDGSAINPFPSVRAAERTTRCSPPENFGQPGDLQYPLDTDAQVVHLSAPEGDGAFILSGNGTVFLVGSARTVGQGSHAKADGPCPGGANR
jgi:murein DD-endopeptidase MepM/ murein hydrolase activator NlpD